MSRSLPSPQDHAPAYDHEPDHLPLRPIIILTASFVLFAAVVHVGLWYLQASVEQIVRPVDRPRSIASGMHPAMRNAPTLQPVPWHNLTPSDDLRVLHLQEDEVFAALGWSIEQGRAKIPNAIIKQLAARAATRPSTRGAP